jgi:hypothetical protein
MVGVLPQYMLRRDAEALRECRSSSWLRRARKCDPYRETIFGRRCLTRRQPQHRATPSKTIRRQPRKPTHDRRRSFSPRRSPALAEPGRRCVIPGSRNFPNRHLAHRGKSARAAAPAARRVGCPLLALASRPCGRSMPPPRRPRHRADMPEQRLGSPNAKNPFPKMLSSQPEGKTKMDDET